MLQNERCVWCGEEEATEMLTINPRVNVYRFMDALIEAAAEQPRNQSHVTDFEATPFTTESGINMSESEMVGQQVSRDATLTLREARAALETVNLDRVLRTDGRLPICELCATSITEVVES